MSRGRMPLVDLVQGKVLYVLDFDGTFYPYTHEFDEHCHEKGALAAMQLVNMSSGVNLTYKEAYALKVESLNKHGIGFVEFCDRFGMSHKEWHHLYHESLDANLTAPTPLTARHLEGFPVNVVILSHASRGWIDRKLRDFAIKKMFELHPVV